MKHHKLIKDLATWGFTPDHGWYKILTAMCQAMAYGYYTFTEVDTPRAKKWKIKPEKGEKGNTPKYSMRVSPPKVTLGQVKEKYGTLQVYYELEFEPRFHELAYGENPLATARKIADGYASFFNGIVHLAQTLSARTCDQTGKPGEMHNCGGWFRTLNKEFAKTDEYCVSRKCYPVAPPPKKPKSGGDYPTSKNRLHL